jgi:ABC-type nitrate/sulfonate/bicarbonate transport system permease component
VDVVWLAALPSRKLETSTPPLMQAPIHALVVGAGNSAEFLSLETFMLLFPVLISIVVAPSGMLEHVFSQRLIKSRTLEPAIARLLFRSD